MRLCTNKTIVLIVFSFISIKCFGQNRVNSIQCFISNRAYVDYHGAYEKTVSVNDTLAFTNKEKGGFGFVVARLNFHKYIIPRGTSFLLDMEIIIQIENDTSLIIPIKRLLEIPVDSLKNGWRRKDQYIDARISNVKITEDKKYALVNYFEIDFYLNKEQHKKNTRNIRADKYFRFYTNYR